MLDANGGKQIIISHSLGLIIQEKEKFVSEI
jgi:hypothetical protein